MLRKLITLAITSGLARKAWEHYRRNGQHPVGATAAEERAGGRNAGKAMRRRKGQNPRPS